MHTYLVEPRARSADVVVDEEFASCGLQPLAGAIRVAASLKAMP